MGALSGDGDTVRIIWEVSRAELSARGRKGAAATLARHDPRTLTKAGRAAFLSRFTKRADPKNELPEAERERRAAELRRAYFRDMAVRREAARRAARAEAMGGNVS